VGQNEPLQNFEHRDRVNGALFSRDESRILTWSKDGTARLWAVGQNQPLQNFEHRGEVTGAILSHDEGRILTWSKDGTARLWAVGRSEPLQSFEHRGGVNGALFSRDEGRILSWGEDGTARLWAVGQNQPLQSFEHRGMVYSATFSRDEGRILTGSADGTARLWVVGQHEPIQSFEHKEGWVMGAVFNRDESRILTRNDAGIVRLWTLGLSFRARQIEGGSQNEPIQSFEHKEGYFTGAVLNHDESRILTWSDDGTACLWDVALDEKIPLEELMLELQVRSATRLYGSAELELLSFEEWTARKRELELMRAKRHLGELGSEAPTPAATAESTLAATPESTPAASSVEPRSVPKSWNLVGTWRANVVEQGVPMEITWHVRPDGTDTYYFRSQLGQTQVDGTWRYSNNVLFEEYRNGGRGRGALRWITDNQFELSIIDNGIPAYSGLKRIYQRL
jgi:hypothetical protein